MDLILHIGMGKTGTSAIQSALSASTERLAAQGAEYLGMWFDMLDPRFLGVKNQNEFFNLPLAEMTRAADKFIDFLRTRSSAGVQSFILSNEALSGKARQMKPMIDRLREVGVRVEVIGYARHPAAWLPSAYVQWGIRDKVNPGPVQPYAVKARKLINWYSGLLQWHQEMGDILNIRSYEKATDIVDDFIEAIGLELDASERRVLERGEDAEIVMRALFNNRFPHHVLPDVFDQSVSRRLAAAPKLEKVLEESFDYSETDAIIQEHTKLFEKLADAFGFDLRESEKNPPPTPEISALRNRLFDVVLEITLDQAQRIQRLEHRLLELETKRIAR